jgi:hypothetical protein
MRITAPQIHRAALDPPFKLLRQNIRKRTITPDVDKNSDRIVEYVQHGLEFLEILESFSPRRFEFELNHRVIALGWRSVVRRIERNVDNYIRAIIQSVAG